MPIGKLTLRGWKGFEADIPLWPLTFLVGPNGGGKSSLLEALSLLSHLGRRGTLREDLRPWLRGWPEGIFTYGGSPEEGEARIAVEWKRSSYRLVLTNPSEPVIWEECLRVAGREYIRTEAHGATRVRKFLGKGAGRPLVTSDPYESALGLIARSPLRRKTAEGMIGLIGDIEIYALDPDHLRGTAATPRPLGYVRKGTSLISGLLDAHRTPARWKAVVAALRAIQPDLERVRTVARPRGVILRYAGKRESELDEESDGLVRAAGMFLVRYREDCPAILGFDEPENGFHFSRLVEVACRLAPHPTGRMTGPELVLLATHSPALAQKAVQGLRGRGVGVVSLWRAREGRVAVQSWDGKQLLKREEFDLMVKEAFEGR